MEVRNTDKIFLWISISLWKTVGLKTLYKCSKLSRMILGLKIKDHSRITIDGWNIWPDFQTQNSPKSVDY